MQNTFNGFPKETFQFFSDLSKNNNKQWFEASRSIYDEYVKNAAMSFVTSMAEQLQTIVPGIHAIPKIDKSIFRIHRDTRFSKNKDPYKTQLAFLFWDGTARKMENPGFYMHLTPETFFAGVGMHEFPKDVFPKYRDAVVHKVLGRKLTDAIEKVAKNPDYKTGWKKYKRIPAGYDADHPNAELLLYGGMGFEYEEPLPKIVHEDGFVEYAFKIFKDMSPIHFWLREMLG